MFQGLIELLLSLKANKVDKSELKTINGVSLIGNENITTNPDLSGYAEKVQLGSHKIVGLLSDQQINNDKPIQILCEEEGLIQPGDIIIGNLTLAFTSDYNDWMFEVYYGADYGSGEILITGLIPYVTPGYQQYITVGVKFITNLGDNRLGAWNTDIEHWSSSSYFNGMVLRAI